MIDTHAHLDFPDFKEDREQIISEATAAGVRRIVNIGCDLKSSQASVALAEHHPQVFAAVGVHPHDAKTYTDEIELQLLKLANNFKVVAIGEIGLDFYRDRSPREAQRRAFVRQIILAKQLGLPVVVHIRDAYREAIDTLVAEKAYDTSVVLHCFSGSAKDAERALDYGFSLSFGGTLTFSNSKLSEIVRELPIDRILLETDAPFLTPHPHRGKRNTPGMVKLVYEKLAAIHSSPFAEIESLIDRNAEEFFAFE